MLTTTYNESKKLYVSNLNEGDIAEINYDGNKQIVYIFRKTFCCSLSMVSLNSKLHYWNDITNCSIPVIKIFESGEQLTVIE